MKILKVEFENINSLKGFHEIDFSEEPFLTNSLFAITGPTGSGKSSILDVISLALFNHVPRLGKITRNEIQSKGAILTRNQKNSMARVTYESNNGVFSSQWSIEVNRNGNLNDYEMEIHDHHSGKLLDLKKSMVPNKNEELIGLNYDQFIKAVLLAQGEFAQFLKAKKEERGELLEKITGTGIYRRLGIKAFEKNREANRDIQQQQNEIQIIQRDLLEEEIINKYRFDLKEKTRLAQTYQQEVENINKAIQLKQEINSQSQEIEKQKNAQSKANLDLEKFEAEHGLPLKQHEKVQEEADNLREWKQLKKHFSELDTQKKNIANSLETNHKQQQELLGRTLKITRKEVTASNIEEQLYTFRDTVLELQETKKNKLNSYSAKRDQLQVELRNTGFHFDEQELGNSVSNLESELKNTTDKIENLCNRLGINAETDLQLKQDQLRSQIKKARKASKIFTGILNQKNEIERIKKEIQKEESRIKDLPGKIKERNTETKSAKQHLENAQLKKENLLLKASLEEHRKKLNDGEPCPLCGSEHHPYAHELTPGDNELEKKITDLEKQFQNSNRLLHQLEAEFSSLEKKQKELQDQLSQYQLKFDEKRNEFAEKYSEFSKFNDLEEIEKTAEKLEANLEILAGLEKLKLNEKAFSNALPLAGELKNILNQGKSLKKELDLLYTGKNIQNEVQEIANKWSRIQQEKLNLNERLLENRKRIDESSKELVQIENHLKGFIAESDFNQISEAWQALIPETEATKLRNERQVIVKQIDDSKASIKLLNDQLLKLKSLDTETEKIKLQEQLAERNLQLNSLSNSSKELERILKNQEDRLKRMEVLKLQIEEKEKQTKRWRLLSELIGDSKGKQFNDFAQDLTLSQLLKLANVRLQELSDRYLIDKPDLEEDDGLVAIDEHMGGQRRSVKTLSGGETFILSLSMALALSDLASKNVEINSLFIDEGFGTLDPETLDQTLDTLEKLQAESSKTIGIISHVDSLKERISTQIQLSRNGQGYSSLSIK
ncbi:hypothetical protein ML462_13745 [Gramella lutea]|uniref:Exonuclease SbcC n=1 Tax=Christiangramia lutea TaxID=1607951 RepID=A0A9X1V540_9FLAO|nr:SbcC/MukB-like Walker B domain-containing protein [Christiangramia lutea]MCH4824236.1 hypothetical protein [Christiangramia lutea]